MKETPSWHKHDASTDGVTRDTSSTGPQTLHPRAIKEQRRIGHHDEKQDPVKIARGGSSNENKGPSPGGEVRSGKNWSRGNTHVTK